MKKIIALALLFAAVSVQQGFSQIFAGGGLSLDRTSWYDDTSVTRLEISPLAGYRMGRLDFGLSGQYAITRYEGFAYGSNETSYGIGVFASYALLQVGGFSILGRASTLCDVRITPYKETVLSFALAPIFEYRVSEHFALFTSIGGVKFSRVSTDGEFNRNEIEASLPSDILLGQISLGFTVFFRGL